MIKKFIALFFLYYLSTNLVVAQDYKAVQGSLYAGSLGIGNNPASIVSTPFPWDLNLFSFQFGTATNLYTITNFSLISPGKTSYYHANEGYYQRYLDFDFNVNLLNARISLDRKHALAFGANLRGYSHLRTSSYNINDTLKNAKEFFQINPLNNNYNGNFTSSSWLEAFISYSQTIWESSDSRLNAGFTLKDTRGLSGAVAELQNGFVSITGTPNNTAYIITNASAQYGYSANYDNWQNGNTASQNLKNLFSNSRGSAAIDLGFEYLIKPQGTKINNYEDDFYDYEWKIGLSLLDFGFNQYLFGTQSRSFTGAGVNVTDSSLTDKFRTISSLAKFNDSVSTVTKGFSSISGKFKIWNPTRIVVNVDRDLGNNFYINADLSIGLFPSTGSIRSIHAQELSRLTVTPRWETKTWGAYLPIQFNAENQFLVGGAFKAGPLIMGIHNWANIFSKNKILNGGGYLALVIHPFKFNKETTDKRFDCPGK